MSTTTPLRYTNTRPEVQAEQARTLPAQYYNDPALFQREMRAVHYDMWLHAGRTEQLPETGSYFVVQFAGVNVVVLRNEQGEVTAFHNTCRHRGTLLCKEHEGRLPGRIRCAYHAWTYALDGKLISAPNMEKVQGFDRADYPLNTVATAVWDGHVFINLSANPQPFTDYLAGLDAKFTPWGMEQLKRVERKVYHLQANWKLVIQNYSECMHCPIAHPLLNKYSHYMSGDNEPPQPTYLGGRMDLREGVKTLSISTQQEFSPLPGLSAEQQRQVYYYALLPNLLLNLHPDYMMTFQLWPFAVDRTDVICDWYFHPDAIAKPDFDPSGAIEFWDVTNRQDWELSDLAQAGISTRGYQPGPYSNREELLMGLDKFVLERLARLDSASPRG
jgi:Rieske 2Fe-2S family protein